MRRSGGRAGPGRGHRRVQNGRPVARQLPRAGQPRAALAPLDPQRIDRSVLKKYILLFVLSTIDRNATSNPLLSLATIALSFDKW